VRLAKGLRSLFAVLCFLVYAAAILALHQDRSVAFVSDEDGPIPLVVSHWFYGTKLGLVDPGLLQFFRRHEPTEAAIETAIHRGHQVPLTGRLGLSDDGSGVGGMIATNLGFTLFGARGNLGTALRALPLPPLKNSRPVFNGGQGSSGLRFEAEIGPTYRVCGHRCIC
jgi:hypothetical protein